MIRVAIYGAALAAATSAAAAQARTPVISADPVARAEAYVAGFCGEAQYREGWIERGDFNDDGHPDLILRFWVACYDQAAPFCGSAGCMTGLWYGVGEDRWQLARAHNMQAIEAVTHKGVPALKIYANSAACGKPGPQICESIITWSAGDLLTLWTN